MPTREDLELKVKMIEEIGQKDPSQEIQNAITRARTLLQSFDAAIQANQTADADRIAGEIIALSQSASQLTEQRRQLRPQSRFERMLPYTGYGVLVLVFVGLATFIIFYVRGIGFTRLATIEGTRPLLVLAAIISTITFGGALLLGALFSSDGAFEERFRRAREIFLVFSGVFGTVLGFYFGAGESKGPQLSVVGILEGTTVVAYATGGTLPYKITVTFGPQKQTKTQDTQTGLATFQFDQKTDNIVPMTVSATDSKGQQGSMSLELNAEELKKAGWLLPETRASTPSTTPTQQQPSGGAGPSKPTP